MNSKLFEATNIQLGNCLGVLMNSEDITQLDLNEFEQRGMANMAKNCRLIHEWIVEQMEVHGININDPQEPTYTEILETMRGE